MSLFAAPLYYNYKKKAEDTRVCLSPHPLGNFFLCYERKDRKMETITISLKSSLGERGSEVVELNEEELEVVYGGFDPAPSYSLLGGISFGSVVPNIALGSIVPNIVLPSINFF
jgi:hypothetical protein